MTEHALTLLREFPDYIDDARRGAPLGNSVVGSLMSLTTGAPRQVTEAAVRNALKVLDSEATHANP